MSRTKDFTDKDYFMNILRFLDGYCDLKKLSEINKSSNVLVKRATNLKQIVYDKRNKYNCKMLKNYIIKKYRIEQVSRNRLANLAKLENLEDFAKYKGKMNADCLSYLEDIITYYFNEKNKRNTGFNIERTSLYVSKILYNIILSVKNNYKLKNEKIVLWISQRCLRISYLIGISKAAHTGQYSENIIIDREDVDSASISGG